MPAIKVNGMHCVNCKNAVEKTVRAMPGVKDASVNLENASVEWQDDNAASPTPPEEVKKAIRTIGFQPE